MASYNFGLFVGFNLEKKHCLHDLAIALEYWLAGGRDDTSKEMEKLTQVQERTIDNLAQTMSHSPLLKELLTPLLQAFRTGRSNEFVAAGKDLIDYAILGIEYPGTPAYNDAVIAWQNRWPMPPRFNNLRNYSAPMRRDEEQLVYGKRRHEDACEVGEMNSASHKEQGIKNKRKRISSAGAAEKKPLAKASAEVSKANFALRNTNYYPLLQPRIRSQDRNPQIPTPESEESRPQKEFRRKRQLDIIQSYDKPLSMMLPEWTPGRIKFGPNGLDYVDEYDTLQVVEALKLKVIKNAIPPRKTPGVIAFDDGTLDFENAVVGERDESKLFIEYNTIRRDSNNPNNKVRGDRVQKRYQEAVDFHDADSVKRLNACRGQIFRRNFPEVCRKKFNHPWLQTEMDTVFELVRAQMKTHQRLTWVALANAYNMKIAGQLQKAGEKLVKGGNRKADVLKEDRQAPRRTGASIQGALNKLQEFREMMKELHPTVDEDGNEV